MTNRKAIVLVEIRPESAPALLNSLTFFYGTH